MKIISELQELYQYREMLKNLVRKELRSRYKGSVLCFMWTFLNPLLMLVVFSILFSTVMRINVEKYTMFLFCALLPWNFFQSSVQAAASSIVGNGGLIKKIYFPTVILPLALVVSGVVSFLLSLFILIPALLINNIPLVWPVLSLPLVLLVEFIFTLGLALLVSSINVYFRDVEHITSITLLAWFYLTPVLYPETLIPAQYLCLFKINPMTVIILAFRDIFFLGRWPDFTALAQVGLASVLFLLISYTIFHYLKKRFAEEI